MAKAANSDLFDKEIRPGTTAVPIESDQEAYKVLLQANPNNEGEIRVGNRRSQSIRLTAGNSVTIGVLKNLNEVYVRAENNTDLLAILGRIYS